MYPYLPCLYTALNAFKAVYKQGKMNYITSTMRSDCDGGGSCTQRIMCAYAVAKRLGVKFVHTNQPMNKHNRDQLTDYEWNERWNTLIPYPERTVGDESLTDCNAMNIKFVETLLLREPRINLLLSKRIIDNDVSLLQDARADLRELYNLNIHHPVIQYNPQRLNIALHVRRYTETDCDPSPIRRLFGVNDKIDEYFYSIIEALKQIFADILITFHIYSEGDENQFKRFNEYTDDRCDVKFHLDELIFDSIYHMVNADIFVASISAISYIVHVLSMGKTIAHKNQVHNLLPGTILLDNGKELLTNIDFISSVSKTYNERLNLIKVPLINTPVSSGQSIKLYEAYSQFVGWYNAPNAEGEHKEWWEKNTQPDWVVMDIGANIGLFSVLIGRKAKKVYAIEPFPKTLRILRRNLFLNHITNVEIIPKALGKDEGEKVDKLYREWGYGVQERKFDFATVDSLVFGNGIKVDALKIDVDSFDYEVLQGARATLAIYNPIVIVELNHALGKRGYKPIDGQRFMESMGYKLIKTMDGTENWLFEYDRQTRIQKINNILGDVVRTRKQGFGALANDAQQALEWDQLIRAYGCDAWIETGTYFGETTEYMARMYPDMKIITCEVIPSQYEQAKPLLASFPNITMNLESSEKVIADIDKYGIKKPFFYLDAHWHEYWPVHDELDSIKNGIVCIHDFDIGHPRYGYDAYKGVTLNKEYILPHIGSHIVYCNNPDSNYALPCSQPYPRGRAYICYENKDYLQDMPNLKVLK